MSKFGDKIVSEALKAVQNGYTPTVRPACANFVSAMMRKAGWRNSLTNYVPDFFGMGKQVTSPEPGDLVIFKKTYDAVFPAGIGDEDDKTHVGIVLRGQRPEVGDQTKVGGQICRRDVPVPINFRNPTTEFVHYSSSADKPVIANLSGYWADHLETFIRLPDILSDEPPPSKEYSNFKMFYHPAAPRPKVVIDGKEEWLDEMLITARTRNGTEIALSSHEFEEYPFIRIERREMGNEKRKKGKVKAIEWHLKFE
ncbi:MAG: hypothetical protein K8T10_16240 [Candidatus Eremiobacteraeota bacterium]|nr:hypothetical protein [Candidatus Eremiobacteraeota bacterium]